MITNIMKNKKYFNLDSVFQSKKISANINNTSYIDPITKEVTEGTPEILWQDIVFIKDIKKIWTHGELYASVINKNIEDVDFETDKFLNHVPTSYNVAYNLNNITYVLAYAINELDNKKLDKENVVNTFAYNISEDKAPSTYLTYNTIIEIEKVVSYTLNYLNKSKLAKENVVNTFAYNISEDKAPSTYLTYNTIIEIEKVVSYALNYLNKSKLNSYALTNVLDSYSTAYQVPSAKIVYDEFIKNEYITAYSIAYLQRNKLDISYVTSYITEESTSYQVPSAKAIYKTLDDFEFAVSYSLNDLNLRKLGSESVVNDFSYISYTNVVSSYLTYNTIRELETVTSAAINMLNTIKVDKVDGKGLSTNDFTTAEKTKLANIPEEIVIAQSDWNETDPNEQSYILNKPESIAAILDINYSNLVTLVNNNNLKTGQQYRIIDYTCSSSDSNTQVATNVFDIIVTADTTSKLNENARACHHTGDTYFSSCNLSAWEIKYSLTNDTTRFTWASNSGKGVIYYMKDEFGNECGYDFKNIKFIKNWSDIRNNSSSGTVYCYTFSVFENGIASNVNPTDESVNAKRIITNKGTGHFGNNIIESTIINSKRSLNHNVFVSNLGISGSSIFHYNNILKNSCKNNLFSNNCFNLTMGNNCNFNIMGGYKNDCVFNDNLSYLNFNTNYAGSNSYVLKNVHSFNGVKYAYLTSVPAGLDLNTDYTQFIVKSSDGDIKFRTW